MVNLYIGTEFLMESKIIAPAPIKFWGQRWQSSFPTLIKESPFCVAGIFNRKISSYISSTLVFAFAIILSCCFRICFRAVGSSETCICVFGWTKWSGWCTRGACYENTKSFLIILIAKESLNAKSSIDKQKKTLRHCFGPNINPFCWVRWSTFSDFKKQLPDKCVFP